MSWWCIPDNHSVVVEKLELRQMINDNYQNQLIIDQQQCINLALRHLFRMEKKRSAAAAAPGSRSLGPNVKSSQKHRQRKL